MIVADVILHYDNAPGGLGFWLGPGVRILLCDLRADCIVCARQGHRHFEVPGGLACRKLCYSSTDSGTFLRHSRFK